MNKVSIKDYVVAIVETSDNKFLLINQQEQTRVANNFTELVDILRRVFDEARKEAK